MAGTFKSASFESFDKFWEQLVIQSSWYDLSERTPAGKGKWKFSVETSENLFPPKTRPEGEKQLWMVPQSLLLLQSGFFPNPPFLTKVLGEETLIKNTLVVQIHPETSRAFSLKEGDRIEVQSERGKIQARVHLFEGVRPGCVLVPLGMGHKAFDGTLRNRGANPYPIMEKMVDPQTGLDVAGVTRVKIQKI